MNFKKGKNKKDKLSVFISLVLRHKPEAAGVTLTKDGYANVEDLIKGTIASGREIDLNTLKEIVAEDKKGRYSFKNGFKLIRANQGHSLDYVEIDMEEKEPPMYLYHGTAYKSLESIFAEGLVRRSRMYVHLSDSLETARQVGSRHGEPVILQVSAQAMYNDGHKFLISENGVWQVESVPTKYLEVLK